MTTLIQSTRRDGVMKPGEWRGLTRRGNGPTICSVVVCCPGCGHIVTVCMGEGNGHTIDPDGSVTPQLDCPFKCGFREFVKLADWRS